MVGTVLVWLLGVPAAAVVCWQLAVPSRAALDAAEQHRPTGRRVALLDEEDAESAEDREVFIDQANAHDRPTRDDVFTAGDPEPYRHGKVA